METKFSSNSVIFIIFFYHILHHLQAQLPTNTTGYTCTANQSIFPCQTYAFYRAMAPDFLDLASIGDLFSMSRLAISEPSNISSPSSSLIPDQSLFVPVTCSCNSINATTSLSFANITYRIKAGDTFYLVSTAKFQNLTTYQSVEAVNPTLIPTLLEIGTLVVFPIFCKCPNRTQLQNDQINYLISYVFQPSDTIASIASRFGITAQSVVDFNGGNDQFQPSDTVFVPVSRLPNISQPAVAPVFNSSGGDEREGTVRGLAIGLGICGSLLAFVIGIWVYRETSMRNWKGARDEEGNQEGQNKKMEVSLISDVSDYLDKYKVFNIEELREATDGFDHRKLIQGSVYKGCIGGELYAIKRMKWNAYEELKILQKVNHGNLVKLEGFCIDPEDANCYLVYEYIANGSLHSWLHGDQEKENLNWKMRLRIAVDVANGLQYIHEHTRPQVVHKDIKTSNILLDSNMRAKIANFGLAKSGCNAITMHIIGTQGYIAPEYLSDGVVSTKMDVFSFGVVLLELVSGREAIDGEGRPLWASTEGILEGREERREKRVKGWMDKGLIRDGSCSMESVINVMAVAVACLNKDPSRRPSMVDVVYALCKSDDDLFFDVSEDRLSPPQITAR